MRLLVVLHRWIGVALCLLFAAWFATGIVMIYVPFPSLSDGERFKRSAAIDLAEVAGSIGTALSNSAVSPVDRVRVVMRDARATLVVESTGANIAAIDLGTQQPVVLLSADAARRIAGQFSGQPIRAVLGPIDFDQWIVHQQFDRYRPFFRVELEDSAGTELYVSQTTGEVLQRTTASQRAWNYVGAVVHWIYPTFIRKHWALWDQLVWWLSLAGIVGASLGLTLGIVRLREAWRRGRRGLTSPFVGWMRWHHILGLLAGAFVLSWIVSGWLSMDHGRLFSEPEPTAGQLQSYRNTSIADAIGQTSFAELADLAGVREFEFSAVAGRPIVITRYDERTALWVVEDDGRMRERNLTDEDIEAAVKNAWPNAGIVATTEVATNDVYAHLREGSLGSHVRRTVLDDARATWVHVDPSTGRILSVMDRSRRLYRWLFNGLHSFDFPVIVNRRPLWDLTMIALLLGGFVFSATSVVIGYRAVARKKPRAG